MANRALLGVRRSAPMKSRLSTITRSASSTSLPVPRFALEAALDEPHETLAVQAGNRLHLIQEMTTFLATGVDIPLLHQAQIPESLVNHHFIVSVTRSLGRAII